MSIKAMNWAFGIKLEPVKKMILLSIADCANDQGEAFPGYAEIASKSSVCAKTVQRNTEKLQQMGLIKITVRKKGKRYNSNLYHCQLDVLEPLPIKPKEKKGGENKEPVDTESIPEKGLPMDTESIPEEKPSMDTKSTPMDTIESIPMDPRSPHNHHYPSLTTDSDTDENNETESNQDSGVFGSELVRHCHPYLYWFLRYMEQKAEGSLEACRTFSTRMAEFGLSGNYCQKSLLNFLTVRQQSIDHYLLQDPDRDDYDVMECLIDEWPVRAEEFIQEADEALADFRRTLLVTQAA